MDVRTAVKTNGGDWIPRFGELWKTQVAELQAKFGASVESVEMPPEAATDMPTIYIKKDGIVDVLRHAKDAVGFGYGFLSDITATDEECDPRFEVVYHLFSQTKLNRIRFKVRVSEGQEVPTATSVWEGANWAEREVWDMFGIRFTGHPNLIRILMDERWQGHPLRKDYPLRGYQIFTEPQQVHPDQLK